MAKFFNKMKDLFVESDEDMDYEENDGYEGYEEEEYVEEEVYEKADSNKTAHHSSRGNLNVIRGLNAGNPKIVIVEPKSYDESAIVASHLKDGKTVIVNLEALSNNPIKKRIFDFISGAAYVLDGTMQNISKHIYILAPRNVDVNSNLKKELESPAAFPWQNSGK